VPSFWNSAVDINSAKPSINHSGKVFIDRVTGTISISGKAGDYTGQCQAIDPNAAAKF
jgi:hypothetical protein